MSRRITRRVAALLSAVALAVGGAVAITATEAPTLGASGCCTGYK